MAARIEALREARLGLSNTGGDLLPTADESHMSGNFRHAGSRTGARSSSINDPGTENLRTERTKEIKKEKLQKRRKKAA